MLNPKELSTEFSRNGFINSSCKYKSGLIVITTQRAGGRRAAVRMRYKATDTTGGRSLSKRGNYSCAALINARTLFLSPVFLA